MFAPKLIRVAVLFGWMMMVVAPPSVPIAVSAEPTQPSPGWAESSAGVLVLADGGVLTGRISQSADDRYVVARGGAEISVPAAHVAIVCSTLDEAYQRQRGAMQNPTADSHLTLADWCLTCGLYSQAAQELLAARALDPRHPKLELLERRLAVIAHPAPKPPTTTSTPATTNPQSAKAGPSVQLPAPADGLPDGVVERFTRRVQPLLVNNCTTAGCHHPGGPQSFELDRALLHGMANRRSTMHNLAAVLALVDRERPHESPLLTIPRRDHGGMDHPIFGPRQSQQFQQLVDWVAMVTNTSAGAEEPPATNDAPAAGPPAESARPLTRWREPVTRVTYDKDGKVKIPSPSRRTVVTQSTAEGRDDAAGLDDATLPPITPSPLRYGAHIQHWQPKDPFDPEIFNRQTRQTANQNASASPQN
jgi:hypothetical protein